MGDGREWPNAKSRTHRRHHRAWHILCRYSTRKEQSTISRCRSYTPSHVSVRWRGARRCRPIPPEGGGPGPPKVSLEGLRQARVEQAPDAADLPAEVAQLRRSELLGGHRRPTVWVGLGFDVEVGMWSVYTTSVTRGGRSGGEFGVRQRQHPPMYVHVVTGFDTRGTAIQQQGKHCGRGV